MKIKLNAKIGAKVGANVNGKIGGRMPNLGPVGEALLDKIAEKNNRLSPEEIQKIIDAGYVKRGTGFANKVTGKFVSNKEIDRVVGRTNQPADRIAPESSGDPVYDVVRSIQGSVNAFVDVILHRENLLDEQADAVDDLNNEIGPKSSSKDTSAGKADVGDIAIFKKIKALAGIAVVFLLQLAYPIYLKAKEMFTATAVWVKKMNLLFQERVLPFFTVDIPRFVEDIKDFFVVKVPSYFSQFVDAFSTGIQNILDVPKEVLFALEGFATSFARDVIGTVSPWVSKIGLKLDQYDAELKQREQRVKDKQAALSGEQVKREKEFQDRKRVREIDRLAFEAVKRAERDREDKLRAEEFARRRREAQLPPAQKPPALPSPAPAPAPAPTPTPTPTPAPAKPGAKEDPSMLVRATRAASNFTALGITNKYAQQAILKVAAKESGIQATKGEAGAKAWLATVSSNKRYTYAKKTNLTGFEYMREVFPQLKYIEGGRYMNDGELLNAIKSGDEFFFDLAYGIGNPTQSLGNKFPGDGYKFRGRGYIQITGRGIYTKIGKILNLPLDTDPDLVSRDADVAGKATALYLANSLGNGDYKRGIERLNSFKDADTALKYITLNVASGGAGLNAALLQKKLQNKNFQQQLLKAEEKGGVAVAAVNAADGQRVATATQNADIKPPPPAPRPTSDLNGQKVSSADNKNGGRTSPPNADGITRGYKDHFAVA
jgi:hypothetical protein